MGVRSRFYIKESRLENCHESCVFVDNDAHAKLLKCFLHSADAGVVLNDRAHTQISRCDMRLFRRGAIGQVCNLNLLSIRMMSS